MIPGVRARFTSGLARQLGEPDGWRGRLVGMGLNRGNRSLVAAAVQAADVRPGQAVADVGFGGGVGLGLLLQEVGSGGRVVGVDISATMLRSAARRYRRECSSGALVLREGTLLDLPLPDRSLDAIITVNTVYFVDDLAAVFAETARVLRSGGRIAVGIGDPDAMAQMPVTGHGFRLRTVDELTRLLEDAGLGEIRHERVGSGPGATHLLAGQTA